MLSRTPIRLLGNSDWPPIIDRLLDGGPGVRDQARHEMWEQVATHIVQRARLPMGPLNDDDEVRKDLALRVLEKLERRDYLHVHQWRDRQRRKRDHVPWWSFVQIMTWNAAIDLARQSRQNLAPRGKPFAWARVLPIDPIMLSCTVDELRDYFAELQRVLGGDTPPGPPRATDHRQDADREIDLE